MRAFLKTWISHAMIKLEGREVYFRIAGRRLQPRPLLLINVSRELGFGKQDPVAYVRRQIRFMPKDPIEIGEPDFEFGNVFRSQGSKDLHMEIRPSKKLIAFMEGIAERDNCRDAMVLPMAHGNVPVFYADRKKSEAAGKRRTSRRSTSVSSNPNMMPLGSGQRSRMRSKSRDGDKSPPKKKTSPNQPKTEPTASRARLAPKPLEATPVEHEQAQEDKKVMKRRTDLDPKVQAALQAAHDMGADQKVQSAH